MNAAAGVLTPSEDQSKALFDLPAADQQHLGSPVETGGWGG